MPLLIFFLLQLVPFVTDATEPSSNSDSPATPPCSAPAYQQFDFWLGHWQVFDPQGEQVGTNRIEKILGGCVIKESYITENGYEGFSFNSINKVNGQWHQTWVDNSGLLLQLDGGWNGDAMVLAGEGIDSEGASIEHRISWTPLKSGEEVRQVWQIKKADTEWQTVFDGRYKRVPK